MGGAALKKKRMTVTDQVHMIDMKATLGFTLIELLTSHIVLYILVTVVLPSYQNFVLTQLVFVFQAEDGIRDRNVTGVQTCALPISQLRDAVPSQSPVGLDLRLARAP